MTVPLELYPNNVNPYEKINFCSNILENVGYLIADNGFYPIIINKGSIPQVWIFVRSKDKIVIPLIQRNAVLNVLLRVEINDGKKQLVVYFSTNNEEHAILILNYSYASILHVDKIDHTFFGYNIKGSKNELLLGNQSLKRNRIVNTQSFIAIGN